MEAIKGKRKARKLVLQALYQWLMSNNDVSEIDVQFQLANDINKMDYPYFKKILYGVTKDVEMIEQAFIPFLDRDIQKLNPIELSVLRLSTFELLNCPETPYKVILDEAINLNKLFGSREGYRYVNGVLNNLVRSLSRFDHE